MSKWEIFTPQKTVEKSQEPFCEEVEIFFNQGDNEYSALVPVESFNNEVDSDYPGSKLFSYIPYDTEFFLGVYVKLPDTNIPWNEAIKLFEKYLRPNHKNNHRITNSPILPIVVTSNSWLPLLFLAKRFHFTQLAKNLEKIRLSHTDSIAILSQLSQLNINLFNLHNIEKRICRIISYSFDKIPQQAFQGLEMAPAIIKILQEANLNGDPPSIVNWLQSVFQKFVETRKFSQQMHAIIDQLNVQTAKTAFIIWCYSNAAFPDIDADVFINDFKNELVIKDCYNMLYYNIPFHKIQWLLRTINQDMNQKEISDLMCQLLMHKSYIECIDIFNFSIQENIFNFKLINGRALCYMLPYAFIHPQEKDLIPMIIDEIKLSPNLVKYDDAVETKNRNLSKLPWDVLLSAFNLKCHPRPNESDSNLNSKMNAHWKRLDSIYFHWISNNLYSADENIINSYLNFQTTKTSFIRSPHRVLLFLNFVYELGFKPIINNVQQMLNNTSFDYSTAFDMLANKKNLSLSLHTLSFIRKQIKFSSFLMQKFCNLLAKFYHNLLTPKLVSPINEYSVISCIKIYSHIQNDVLLQEISPIVSFIFNTFSLSDIQNYISNIPIKSFFNNDFLKMIDEDYLLFYFFKSIKLIHGMEIENTIGKYIENIYWSDLSTRAISILLNKDIKFQFDLSYLQDDPILEFKSIKSETICQEIYNKWSEDRKHRFGTKYLVCLPPETIGLYLIDFDNFNVDIEEFHSIFPYIDHSGIQVNLVNNDTEFSPDDSPVILYKNPDSTVHTDISKFIKSLFNTKDVPIIMNALMLHQILEDYSEEWKNFTTNSDNFEFQFHDNEFDSIIWEDPTPTLLPLKKDLICFSTPYNNDIYFKSIPFSCSHNLRSYIRWQNQRIFGCSLNKIPISIFNFAIGPNLIDISNDNDSGLSEYYHTIIQKQTKSCLLSLICESISGMEPEISIYH